MKNFVEQLKALLPDVELSEEFEVKLLASFETAVSDRVQEEVAEVTAKAEEYAAYCKEEVESIEEKANAYAEYVVEEMTQKVEDYAEHVIEEFVAENKKAMVETAEYNRMVSAFNQIKESFEVNFFGLTNEPANNKLVSELSEARCEYNKIFNTYRDTKKELANLQEEIVADKKSRIFESLTSELADTQTSRVQALVEAASPASIEDYEKSVRLMVEEVSRVEKAKPIVEEKEKPSNVVGIKDNNSTARYLV